MDWKEKDIEKERLSDVIQTTLKVNTIHDIFCLLFCIPPRRRCLQSHRVWNGKTIKNSIVAHKERVTQYQWISMNELFLRLSGFFLLQYSVFSVMSLSRIFSNSWTLPNEKKRRRSKKLPIIAFLSVCIDSSPHVVEKINWKWTSIIRKIIKNAMGMTLYKNISFSRGFFLFVDTFFPLSLSLLLSERANEVFFYFENNMGLFWLCEKRGI